MENSSEITLFILTAYQDLGNMKYFYFSIILLLNLIIILENIFLILLIFVDRSLHEPLYVFLCSLFVNQLCGSTALFPLLLVNILSDTHEISKTYCILQIFFLCTYASVELCNLSAMAYDRYLSICHPLHYNRIMNSCKLYTLIVLIWVYSSVQFSISLSLNVQLPLCDNVIHKMGCDNYSLQRLACTSTTMNNLYDLVGVVVVIGVPLVPILYSYTKILQICSKASKETQLTALNTCAPHLISLVHFSVSCLFEVFQNRFDMTYIPQVIRNILAVYFLICPPLFNPIMYGVKMTKIRKALKKRLTG